MKHTVQVDQKLYRHLQKMALEGDVRVNLLIDRLLRDASGIDKMNLVIKSYPRPCGPTDAEIEAVIHS